MVVSSIIPFFCVNELLPFGQHHRKIQMVAVKYLNVAKITMLPCGFWFLVPHSTIFQLYHGSEFYWWRKPDYLEKTTDQSQVTDKQKRYKIKDNNYRLKIEQHEPHYTRNRGELRCSWMVSSSCFTSSTRRKSRLLT
jgi:hypothetical protein